MMFSVKVITPPASEPVTLDEAKAWLKLETSDDDGVVIRLIATARQMVERYSRRALITQLWRLGLRQRPNSASVLFPIAPVSQITAAFWLQSDTTKTSLDVNSLMLDSMAEPPCLILPDMVLSAFTGTNTLMLDVQCGYGDQASAVPEALKQAILVFIAQAYEQRCATDRLPIDAIAGLIAPYMIRRI